MQGEATWEVQAAKYAALADPARVHIVELLMLGDRSPSELQRILDLPSNLVAHHLRVLERAGFITRHRSEADQRRSYVSLAVGAFAQLLPGATRPARRVVFVCSGNAARSQLAAAIWPAYSPIPVASAGTHPADRIETEAVAVAEAHGLRLNGSVPRGLPSVLTEEDFLITVCDRAREELAGTVDAHWSVPDPARHGTSAAFDAAFDDLRRRIKEIVPRLVPA